MSYNKYKALALSIVSLVCSHVYVEAAQDDSRQYSAENTLWASSYEKIDDIDHAKMAIIDHLKDIQKKYKNILSKILFTNDGILVVNTHGRTVSATDVYSFGLSKKRPFVELFFDNDSEEIDYGDRKKYQHLSLERSEANPLKLAEDQDIRFHDYTGWNKLTKRETDPFIKSHVDYKLAGEISLAEWGLTSESTLTDLLKAWSQDGMPSLHPDQIEAYSKDTLQKYEGTVFDAKKVIFKVPIIHKKDLPPLPLLFGSDSSEKNMIAYASEMIKLPININTDKEINFATIKNALGNTLHNRKLMMIMNSGGNFSLRKVYYPFEIFKKDTNVRSYYLADSISKMPSLEEGNLLVFSTYNRWPYENKEVSMVIAGTIETKGIKDIVFLWIAVQKLLLNANDLTVRNKKTGKIVADEEINLENIDNLVFCVPAYAENEQKEFVAYEPPAQVSSIPSPSHDEGDVSDSKEDDKQDKKSLHVPLQSRKANKLKIARSQSPGHYVGSRGSMELVDDNDTSDNDTSDNGSSDNSSDNEDKVKDLGTHGSGLSRLGMQSSKNKRSSSSVLSAFASSYDEANRGGTRASSMLGKNQTDSPLASLTISPIMGSTTAVKHVRFSGVQDDQDFLQQVSPVYTSLPRSSMRNDMNKESSKHFSGSLLGSNLDGSHADRRMSFDFSTSLQGAASSSHNNMGRSLANPITLSPSPAKMHASSSYNNMGKSFGRMSTRPLISDFQDVSDDENRVQGVDGMYSSLSRSGMGNNTRTVSSTLFDSNRHRTSSFYGRGSASNSNLGQPFGYPMSSSALSIKNYPGSVDPAMGLEECSENVNANKEGEGFFMDGGMNIGLLDKGLDDEAGGALLFKGKEGQGTTGGDSSVSDAKDPARNPNKDSEVKSGGGIPGKKDSSSKSRQGAKEDSKKVPFDKKGIFPGEDTYPPGGKTDKKDSASGSSGGKDGASQDSSSNKTTVFLCLGGAIIVGIAYTLVKAKRNSLPSSLDTAVVDKEASNSSSEK